MKLRPAGHVIAAGLVVCTLFSFTLASVGHLFKVTETMAPTTAREQRTLVIDPGHGGADGGAVSVGGTTESDINLAISEKIELLAAFFGESPVLTRDSKDIDYPEGADSIREKKVADQRARVALINSVPDAFLISVHQNKYTSAGPRGAQTFFTDAAGSEEFAVYLQNLLVSELDPANKRPAARMPKDIYLMKNIVCPAVLIECGFLSNKTESALLESDGYQLKTAVVITSGYIGYTR